MGCRPSSDETKGSYVPIPMEDKSSPALIKPTCVLSVDELMAKGFKHGGDCAQCGQPVFRHSNLTDVIHCEKPTFFTGPPTVADCRCTFCREVAYCVPYESNNTYQFTCRCVNPDTRKPYRGHTPRFPWVSDDVQDSNGKYKFGCLVTPSWSSHNDQIRAQLTNLLKNLSTAGIACRFQAKCDVRYLEVQESSKDKASKAGIDVSHSLLRWVTTKSEASDEKFA